MTFRYLLVNVIPVEDNFVHLSSKLIREFNDLSNHKHPVCLKVVTDSVGPLFMSYSQTPCNSNGDDAFNISHELLTTAKLCRSQSVCVAVNDQVYPLERISVNPATDEDWELLVLNNVSLQENILQQLRIVQKNQIFPIWVSKFIHLKVFINDLGNGVLVGSLKESTEIVVIPHSKSSNNNTAERSINNDQNIDDNVQINTINQNYFIPITKYHNQFIYRTISVDKTLLESNFIYDYCALISKSHMSILFQNNDQYSPDNSFVKISLLHNINQTSENSENKQKLKNPSVIIRLCPLNPQMNNVDKMEQSAWPTIYVTRVLKKMLNLKMNSKVILEPIKQIDNDICKIKNIFISPLKDNMKNVKKQTLVDSTIKRLKDELKKREVLVLNNSSLLQVTYNQIITSDVLVKYSPSNVSYIILNNYNFEMLTFKSIDVNGSVDNRICSKEETEKSKDCSISNMPKLEYYRLNCFKEIMKIGSLCLKFGLQIFTTLPQTFFASDNILITGDVATGKTSTAVYFCQKFSKCPYFVKIIWINGRFLAGKLWETVLKQIKSHFEECLYYQPAIIVIDDVDDLCHLNSEPNEHADMSKIYLRPLHLLLRMIENYTDNHYCIRVICTAKPLSRENENLFTKQFKHVFKTVMHIPTIDKEDKKLIILKLLKNIVFDKDVTNDFLMNLCEKMDSYVIQDLIDYCDKVLFEIFKGGCDHKLTKNILTNVFENTVPLSMHNLKLYKEKNFNFSLVGGLKEEKQIITETIIWPSLYSDVFRRCPLKLQSGILLYGAPGTGKTLLAKAIVGESNLNFITVNGPELLSKYVGESEKSVRDVFTRAQNAKPCIIFFDEFESIAPRRGSDQTGVTDRVVNQFLTQLDGVDVFEGVWVIAATSRPDLIDPALLRPGRIGVKLHCPIPSTDDREDILRVLSNKVTLSEDIDLHSIATETNNYTGADLSGLLYSALSIAEIKVLNGKHDEVPLSDVTDPDNGSQVIITTDDFREALKTTKPSLSQSDINHYDRIHRIFSGKEINGSRQINVGDDGGKSQQKATFA